MNYWYIRFSFFLFSLIFLAFLWFSFIFYEFLLFSSIFFDFLWFSLIFFDFPWFPLISFDFWGVEFDAWVLLCLPCYAQPLLSFVEIDDNFSCRTKRSASLCTDNDLKNSGIRISPTAAIHTERRKHAFP